MKTSVTMIRRMGQFDVQQRTKDGYFNATYLLKQWSEETNERKDISSFLSNKSTKDLIEAIEADTSIPVSKKGVAIIRKGGKSQGTWMQPYLFIDFAMWINSTFKLQVIKFVHDQLIEFRNESGDLTKELNSAVQRFDNINYPKLARGLNHIIFGKHINGIRNGADQTQLDRLNDLQKKLSFACDMGYIDSFENLMEEMRRIWNTKRL